ncbi:MAG: hypothetical protein WA667_09795 [Candidatus Nitrosopolaris sp.]
MGVARRPHVPDTQLFDKISDHLLISDFYRKFRERHTALHNPPVDNDKIRELNAQCLLLCERVLREIDWTKYRGWHDILDWTG